ncbi:MAG: hypothetical protein HGA49_00290 [Eubacteriaceae bacterium]|nr:hypothetical protein [Eubacteriaceae bacterium]
MYEYSKVELDSIVRFLDARIIIDSAYSDSVKFAIKKVMNRNYRDEIIEMKIQDTQNLRDSLYLLDKCVNNFMGIVCERIEMFNYNYLKNKEGTITLTNPDPTSKSDLLHIHDKKKYSITSCGPDVKFGSADYVVEEYIKKHLMNEESHGFIDITGYLKAEDYCEKTGFKTLNKSQNAKILEAIRKYRYKPTIPSEISRMEFHRIFYYYIHYLTTGILPSEIEISDLSDLISSINKNELTESDIRNKICVDQPSLTVSDISDLRDEIINANKMNSNKPAESAQLNSENEESRSVISEKMKTPNMSKWNSFWINPNTKNVVKVLKYVGIGIAAVGGGVIIAKNPELRKKGIKYIKDLQVPQKIGKGIKSVSENMSVIIPTVEDAIENSPEIGKHINADNISSFREAFDMFCIGLITKIEFHEIANSISEKNGKNPIKYLRLLVNFFGDNNAANLLEDL